MSYNNYNDQSRTGELKHHSQRGTMPRNAGNFTRGAQLTTHEIFMWFGSIKYPVLFTFFAFSILMSLSLSFKMAEYEIQMVLMRLYAEAWLYVAPNSERILNLTDAAGITVPIPVTMMEYHPDVMIAWGKFKNILIGCLYITLAFCVPATIWFTFYSHNRGKNILKERHQRGSMLVDAADLIKIIRAYNSEKFKEEAAKIFPGMAALAVQKLPFIERKQKGLHAPYALAKIPYPWRNEQSHTMLIGTTGTGKTTLMRDMLRQLRARRDRAVVFDLTGAFVEAFFDPKTDTILNPMDQRCPSWSIFSEAHSQAEFTNMASALIPSEGGTSDNFWVLAARTLFVEACMKLVENEDATMQNLISKIMLEDLKDLNKFLENTSAEPLTSMEASKMAESIRAVFNTNAQALRFIPTHNEPFAISDWIKNDDDTSRILFITSTHNELALNKPLLTLWMNIAVHTLMELPRTRELRTWFFFDEMHALHRLPAIEDGLTTARGFGGAFMLGIHSFAKLADVYGRDSATHLTSLARTKLILSTADRETAEKCSDIIGKREVRMMDESYTYGYNDSRDASSITPRTETQPLVIADDIKDLPDLHGFLVYPQGFDAARIKIEYVDYPVIAPRFIERENIKPIQYIKPKPGSPKGDMTIEGQQQFMFTSLDEAEKTESQEQHIKTDEVSNVIPFTKNAEETKQGIFNLFSNKPLLSDETQAKETSTVKNVKATQLAVMEKIEKEEEEEELIPIANLDDLYAENEAAANLRREAERSIGNQDDMDI